MLVHHEERVKSSPENLPNFTNPLASKINSGNDTFTFKEVSSQSGRLYFVEETRKEIGDHDIDKHWNLVIIRELNGERTIMSIWSFKRRRDPDVRLIKHKAHLCAHGSMQQWGVNYWDTY